ncbi:MAG: electron transport complex subunit RsxC [Gammaproteobacteria bacterium]|nr:electron transport complex subunit RsxC [Gammaproteobacteria bacterium]
MKGLWRFPGGLRLAGAKGSSGDGPILPLAPPPRVYLPLRQHVGAPARPVVEVGQAVARGELVAEAGAFVSAAVHASIAGRVVEIGDHELPHPPGVAETCVVIAGEGGEEEARAEVPLDPDEATVETLRERVRAAGIVGLGGAAFPSAAKLKPSRPIHTLVINGVECEPYITCDDALMRHRPEAVIRGALVLLRLVAAERCLVAVEDNKPAAAAALREAVAALAARSPEPVPDIAVVEVPTRFPAGGEKQLVWTLTGRAVPRGGLPYEVGVVCLNAGTTAAVDAAVHDGRPLVSRVVTVTGPGIRRPGNFEVPLGTPVRHLLEAAGGTTAKAVELVMGGPMMGRRLETADTMVVKGTNCILVTPRPDIAPPRVMPCIRCGRCAAACPMNLLPQQLYWHARGRTFDKLEPYGLKDCIECGCCAVVCPSHIPLVSFFRYAKTELADRERRRHRAEESRARTDARNARLEQQRQEREARKAARKAARARPRSAPASDEAVEDTDAAPPRAAGGAS